MPHRRSERNPIDWIIMTGAFAEMLPYELPWTVGYDVSGVVVEVGAYTKGFAIGDEVYARADGRQAPWPSRIRAVTRGRTR